MDVDKALRDLYSERKRLDAAIASLERRLKTSPRPPQRKRGRKSMSAEERHAVSERMSRYWEARRAQSRALAAASDQAAK